VVPRSNPELPAALRRAMANVPGLRAAVRLGLYWAQEALAFGMTKRPNTLKFIEAYAKYNIRRSVKDRELRRKLTPHYRIGCKRILNSSTYYGAVADPKTELVTDGITRITRDGIVTADGRERKADVIVYGTGFHVTDSYTYVQIKGRNGEDLVDRWNREGIGAHRGITVADVPNLFFLLGPNTGLGHNSVVFMIESQIHYVADAIKTCDKLGAQALAPTRAAQDKFNDELQQQLSQSVWNSGGCSSWYLDEHGRNTVLWGGYTWQYWRATRSVKRDEYQFFGVRTGSRAKHSAVAAQG
jgi:cation diffusion facilitator CzcD-associated flavoprotein CzcO